MKLYVIIRKEIYGFSTIIKFFDLDLQVLDVNLHTKLLGPIRDINWLSGDGRITLVNVYVVVFKSA